MNQMWKVPSGCLESGHSRKREKKNSASVAESCRVLRLDWNEGDDAREDPKGKIRGDSVDRGKTWNLREVKAKERCDIC